MVSSGARTVRLGSLAVLLLIGWASSEVLNSLGITQIQPDESIVFKIYSRENLDGERIFANQTLFGTPYNHTKCTTFIIHGYLSRAGPGSGVDGLKDSILAVDDKNVVTVDWSRVDSEEYTLNVATIAPLVAETLARMVGWMDVAGADSSCFHLIGHSFGGEISCLAAANSSAVNGRVTVLDGAGPGYETFPPSQRCHPAAARSVHVYHTSVTFGIPQPVGTLDAYFNCGREELFQPGCINVTLDNILAGLTGLCSHCWSFTVFNSTIHNKEASFIAEDRPLTCASNGTTTVAAGTAVRLGYWLPDDARGTVFVTAEAPTMDPVLFDQTCPIVPLTADKLIL